MVKKIKITKIKTKYKLKTFNWVNLDNKNIMNVNLLVIWFIILMKIKI